MAESISGLFYELFDISFNFRDSEISVSVLSIPGAVLGQGQASGMDGTLTLIFAISKTIRDCKKFIKKY